MENKPDYKAIVEQLRAWLKQGVTICAYEPDGPVLEAGSDDSHRWFGGLQISGRDIELRGWLLTHEFDIAQEIDDFGALRNCFRTELRREAGVKLIPWHEPKN